MARRSPESAVKRARENALREKRELKRAKKEARAAARELGPPQDDGIEHGPEVQNEAEPEPEAPPT